MEKLKSTSDPVASRSNGNSPVATKTASPGTPSLPDSSRRQAKFKGDDVDAALENMLRAAEKTRKSHDTDFLISEILKYALEAESIYAPEEKRKREAEEVQELTREWSTLQKSALTTCKELHGAVLIGDNKQSLLDDYLERAQVAVEDLKESNDLLVSLQSRDPGNAEWGRKHRRTDSLVRTITGRCDDLKAQALPSRPPQ